MQRLDAALRTDVVAPVDDPLEHQAESFADRIGGSRPHGRPGVAPSVTGTWNDLGPGRSLESTDRERFERALDTDLDEVQVHTGAAAVDVAARIDASAFSVGTHIAFGDGNYAPHTSRGQRLLAHELAHVAQHRRDGTDSVVHRAPQDAVDLDKKLEVAFQQNDWQSAAEHLSKFNDLEVIARLGRYTLNQLRSLQLGAVLNPRLGKSSAIASHIDKAIQAALKGVIAKAAQGSPDLTLPKSEQGNGAAGQPGSITVGGGVGGDPRVPAAQQQQLDPDTDWSRDPTFVDNGIVGASYNVLTGLFEIAYHDGTLLTTLDYDQVLAGAAGSPPLATRYFRNTANGRIYPTRLARNVTPILTACAVELHRKEPEARKRLKDALINVAVSAHGVSSATVRAGQTQAGGGSRGKQQPADEETPKPAPAKPQAAKPQPAKPASNAPQPVGGSAPAKPSVLSAAPQPGGGAKAGAGLQSVSVGARPKWTPIEGVPDSKALLKFDGVPGISPRATFQWAAPRLSGEVTVNAAKLGPGTLVAADQAATVTGATVVADGLVKVGAVELAKAAVVTGGRILPGAAPAGARVVLYALVMGDDVALIVSSAPGTDRPAQAPGAATTPAKAPGTERTPTQAPAKDTGSVKAPGAPSSGPVTAPGPVRIVEKLLAASKDRAKAAQILTANKVKPTKAKIDQYLILLEAYNAALTHVDESLFEYFEEEALVDINIGYLRGSRPADFAAADAMADALYDKPSGYTRQRREGELLTWHHHPEMGRMILMPRSEHGLSHWGGFAVWKLLTSDP